MSSDLFSGPALLLPIFTRFLPLSSVSVPYFTLLFSCASVGHIFYSHTELNSAKTAI